MRAGLTRRVAAIGSLVLPVVVPAEAHDPRGDGNTGSCGPIDAISAGTLAGGQSAAAPRSEFIRLGQLDDGVPLAAAAQGKHGHPLPSTESISLAAASGITNAFMVAIRFPHARRSDISEAAQGHGSRLLPNDDLVVGDAGPADGPRAAVGRRFA